MNLPAYSYIRFSTPEQRKSGRSLERQTEKTEAFCTRHGFCLAKINYRDLGISAFRGKNKDIGALSAFVKGVEDGSIPTPCALVCESLDRLSRDEIVPAQSLFLRLINAGVTVCTTGDESGNGERIYTKELLNAQPFLVFEIIITFVRANEESETKSRRGKANWKSKRNRASEKPLTKMLPFWLTMERGKIVERGAEADLVRRIFLMASEGQGRRSIASKLNKEGVRAIGKKTTWDSAYIRNILTSRRVIGEYQPHLKVDGKMVKHGEPIIGYYPQTIPMELWYRAQNCLAGRNKKFHGRDALAVNLFTHLFKDADTGDGYNTVNKGKWKYLISASCINGRTKFIGLPLVEFEEAFLTYLGELDVASLSSRKPTDIDERINAAKGELAEQDLNINGMKARLLKKYSDAIADTLEQAEEQRKAIEERLQNLEAEGRHDGDKTFEECRSLLALYQELRNDTAFREKLKSKLNQLIEKVYMRVGSEGGFHRSSFLQICFTGGGTRLMQMEFRRQGRGGRRLTVSVLTVQDAHKKGMSLPLGKI